MRHVIKALRQCSPVGSQRTTCHSCCDKISLRSHEYVHRCLRVCGLNTSDHYRAEVNFLHGRQRTSVTSKLTGPLEILYAHYLCMFDPWPALRRYGLHTLARFRALANEEAFVDVQHHFVRAVADAVDILPQTAADEHVSLHQADAPTVLQPSAQNASTMACSASGELRMIPFVSGLSEYGSRSAAPQEPSAPVIFHQLSEATQDKSKMLTIREQLDTLDVEPAVLAVILQAGDRGAPVRGVLGPAHRVHSDLEHQRTPSSVRTIAGVEVLTGMRPSSAILQESLSVAEARKRRGAYFWNMSRNSTDANASCTLVRPTRRASSKALFRYTSICSSVHGGECTNEIAVSIKIPDKRISPHEPTPPGWCMTYQWVRHVYP